MPELRTCTVAYRDAHGLTHSVDVTAESLYEAAVLGLRALHAAELVDHPPAIGTHLEITVKHPVASHTITVGRLREWLRGGGKSPMEAAAKARLRGMLPWLKDDI